ncbi:MAG: hypothetical protein WBD74_13495 [Candidatus Aquilonibacter sp.]
MGVVRSIRGLALLALLLCSSVAAQAAAPPLARWTIFHVSGAGEGTWSTWYTQAPWPFKVRFKCEHGAVILNAVNTDTLHQGVSVHYWDVEATQDALERAMQSRKALQNKGFQLPAMQATTLPLIRPELCSAASNSFVFGAVLGT